MDDAAPSLIDLGWRESFARALSRTKVPGCIPARVIRQDRGAYLVHTEAGVCYAEPTGRLWRMTGRPDALPCVGDWVAAVPVPGDDKVIVHEVLRRAGKLSRKIAGGTCGEQMIAANVDVLFVVLALDQPPNLRRLERYLVLAAESAARAVVVLNKADLCLDPGAAAASIHELAPELRVCTVNAHDPASAAVLGAELGRGVTGAFVGASGVGKSSLVNVLLGVPQLSTGEVREHDGRGRHTTTRRELLLLPGGGCVIDTPGMREVGLWIEGEELASTFADIGALAASCRFSDCRHEQEPGCAVQVALAHGVLARDRWSGYAKLRGEHERFGADRPEQRRRVARRDGRLVKERAARAPKKPH